MTIKKLFVVTFSYLCCTTLLMGSLHAVEETKQTPRESVMTGERRLSNPEALKKMYAQISEQEDEQESKTIEDSSEEPVVPRENLSKVTIPEKQNTEGSDSLSPVTTVVSKALVYTTHPGAFLKPFIVSFFGDSVEFRDGSTWNIHPLAWNETQDWLQSDDVIVTVGNPFSAYPYYLTNQQTGVSVAASLWGVYSGYFTKSIFSMTYFHLENRYEIELNDASRWSMSPVDNGLISEWIPGDIVIIGINNGDLSAIRPNILINVNTNNISRGSCYFY